MIALNYLKRHLITDVISTIPVLIFHFVVNRVVSDSPIPQGPNVELHQLFLHIVNGLVSLKLFHLITLNVYIKKSLRYYCSNEYTIDIVGMIVFALTVLHLATCMQLMRGIIDLNLFDDGVISFEWYDPEVLEKYKHLIKYLVCSYRALLALASAAGVGLFAPTTISDKVFLIILIIIGRVYTISMLAQIFQFIQTMSASQTKYKVSLLLTPELVIPRDCTICYPHRQLNMNCMIILIICVYRHI